MILAGVVVALVGVVAYLMFHFYDSGVAQANYIKTMAARSARHNKKPEPEEGFPNPSNTKPGSEGEMIPPVTDQENLNTSTDATIS